MWASPANPVVFCAAVWGAGDMHFCCCLSLLSLESLQLLTSLLLLRSLLLLVFPMLLVYPAVFGFLLLLASLLLLTLFCRWFPAVVGYPAVAVTKFSAVSDGPAFGGLPDIVVQQIKHYFFCHRTINYWIIN